MESIVYSYSFAGHTLYYAFRFPATRYYFRPLPRKAEHADRVISVTDEAFARARALLPPESEDAYVEYRMMILRSANALLRHGCCIFHAASFLYRGKAWLLTAPSGTGKTTQYQNWEASHPGELTMISGDMPVLELREDGGVWVHPSPWNGKENIGNRISAPLGGVVYLRQGKRNELSRPPVSELLTPVFRQFLARPETEEDARALGRLADAVFSSYPVWRFVNDGTPASTEMLRSAITESKDIG